ncbi:MAG TPA: protein kinase [Vicinamibacteria bacterium]|jgi:Tol biopolymer transport system component
MPLATGTRLGAYEIVAAIGAGGMGEVYRARDTNLQRDVAVKVLPERLAENQEALARFGREARMVAALSHPNILAIHDLGQAGGVAYAVMELLDGQSLRDELRGGPLPPRKAAAYAAQAASGLAAAHDKGIVHRDLKPENLFVTRDGRLKVLDFGLARQDASAGPEVSESPTLARATDPGTVLGTVGYMSPEQVRGDAVDHRTDIFSLGCVLHEMLSGRRAFGRDTAAETMTAILREDAVSVSDAGRVVPAALERIVAHCLEKKPAERFQSARDLAFDLGNLESSSASTARGAAAPARGASRAGLWVLAGSSALVLLGLGYLVGRRSTPAVAAAPSTRARFEQLTDLSGVEVYPTLSPDGKMLAFVGAGADRRSGDIYLQRVGGHNPINLTADCAEDDGAPAFSPDGERLAYHSRCEGGGVFVMGATGESRRRVTESGHDPSWSPDGKQLAVATEVTQNPLSRTTQSRLLVVEIATGAVRTVVEQDAVQPAWSPNGKRIAFWGLRGGQGGSGRRDIWTVAAEGGEAVSVTDDEAIDWCPVWSGDGRYLYFSSGRGGTMNAWRVPIDEATGQTQGPPEPITTPSRSSSYLALSRDGTRLAYVAKEGRSALYRVGFDPARGRLAGEPDLVLGGSRVMNSLSLSPDGGSITFAGGDLRENIFFVRLDGTGYRQITDDEFRNRGPSWSADGSLITFYSNRSGRYQVYGVRPDGSGLEPFTGADGSSWFPEWSPDGTRVAVSGPRGSVLIDPRQPFAKRQPDRLPELRPGTTFQAVSWSADGSRLAGVGQNADGSSAGVFVLDVASGKYEQLTTTGRTPVLLADGKRLLFDDGSSIVYLDLATGQRTTLLGLGSSLRTLNARPFRLTRDNRTLVFCRSETESDVWMMSVE